MGWSGQLAIKNIQSNQIHYNTTLTITKERKNLILLEIISLHNMFYLKYFTVPLLLKSRSTEKISRIFKEFSIYNNIQNIYKTINN